jgi:hypothetical protein
MTFTTAATAGQIPALLLSSLPIQTIYWELPATVPLAGKQVGALALHLTDFSLPGAQLIYLKDISSNIFYLIDSGAAISIVPHQSLLPPSGPAIIDTNGG